MRLVLAFLFAVGSSVASAATPAPPLGSPLVRDLSVGVLCAPRVSDQITAPNTRPGYVNRIAKAPKLSFAQQVVPAALGVSFGITFTPVHDLVGVRNLTYRPGKATPDVYYSDILAKPNRFRGYGFDTPDEMITGLWRLEGWQGDRLLYSVEFEVVPGASLPDIQAQCQGMS
jgi:hypothetical protein